MAATTCGNTVRSGMIALQQKTGRTVLVTPLPGPDPRRHSEALMSIAPHPCDVRQGVA